jgi:hypothetical protein
MFQRGGPNESDPEMGHLFGLAMPFVKAGIPIQPIQLENVNIPHYLDHTKILLMTYEGMKPLSADVHRPIADWVRRGGTLVFVDADTDPFLKVQEWWNTGDMHYATPRQHLFELLGLPALPTQQINPVGKGKVVFLRRSPTEISRAADGATWLLDQVRAGDPSFPWKVTGSFVLRRGPYVIAAGMNETSMAPRTLRGDFVDLFDPELAVVREVKLAADSRHFLIDLRKYSKTVVASAGQVREIESDGSHWSGTVEGIARTPGVLLLRTPREPREVRLNGSPLLNLKYDAAYHLLWLRFDNQPRPQTIDVAY